MSPFSNLDERALKTMTGELVSACGGGKAVSTLLSPFTPNGRPFSTARISDYCNVSDMTRFMPNRAITKLELAVGVPIVSRWMVDRVQRAPGAAPGAASLHDLDHLIREAGELKLTLIGAVADGDVNSAERAAIRAAITDLRLVLNDLEAKVEQP